MKIEQERNTPNEQLIDMLECRWKLTKRKSYRRSGLPEDKTEIVLDNDCLQGEFGRGYRRKGDFCYDLYSMEMCGEELNELRSLVDQLYPQISGDEGDQLLCSLAKDSAEVYYQREHQGVLFGLLAALGVAFVLANALLKTGDFGCYLMMLLGAAGVIAWFALLRRKTLHFVRAFLIALFSMIFLIGLLFFLNVIL